MPLNDTQTKHLVVSDTGVRNPSQMAERVALFDETGNRISIPSQAELNSQYAPRSSGVAGPDRLVLISGQVHESPTVGSCTLSADTTNYALGTQGHKMTMAGAVTATLALQPLPIGTLTNPKYTGAALMIYVPDATKVTGIEWELWQNSAGSIRQAMSFRSQIGAYGQAIATGWNLIRLPNDYRRATYLIGGADMSTIVGCRILVTTNAAKEDIVEALQAGVNNYVVKPFTPETLKEKIESLLG